ncbi:MAG TPA: DNA polymerase III subunit epsilon [Acidisoma sp.]|nr:DNA polymerase III subunit epsilon [Acidisoma sp.]
MTRSVLFDTETTGLEPREGHRVIEIAALELINDLPTGRQFHCLVHPERDIPEDATRIHGLTSEHLRGKPVFKLVAEELLAFFGADEMLVAHNAPFDFRFLNAEFALCGLRALPPHRMVDTLDLAKARFPGMPNSLDALCRRFGIDLSERTSHNALLDCRLLAEVYIELTGGRQRGLSLAVEDGAVTVAEYEATSNRTLRPIPISAEDEERHARFIQRLKNPIWLRGEPEAEKQVAAAG